MMQLDRPSRLPAAQPFRILLLLSFICVCQIQSAAAKPSIEDPQDNITYTVAVVPQLPSSVTHTNWGPFLHLLSEETGIDFKLMLYKTFLEFEIDLKNGVPDFAYMNPYHQVMAKNTQGYVPLVHDDATKLVGIMVVRKDSPITSVQHLNGKRLAFPSPNAFGASLYLRAMLLEKEAIDFEPLYVASHTNVYRNVVLGLVDAGGGVNKTLEAELPAVKDKLRVLYTIPGVTSHPFSAHARIDAPTREKIIQGILALNQSDTGKHAMQTVHIIDPVRANYKKDYQPLINLKLDKYAETDL